jgi:type IV secretion system protein VirB3
MNEPRRIPIHKSSIRPHLLLGGERKLVLFCALLAALMVFSVGRWFAVFWGILFWLGAVAVLARMGKADPQMFGVYCRHRRYQLYYPAQSGLQAPPTTVKAWR